MQTSKTLIHDMRMMALTPRQNGGGAFVGLSGMRCSDNLRPISCVVPRMERIEIGEVTRAAGSVDDRLEERYWDGYRDCGFPKEFGR